MLVAFHRCPLLLKSSEKPSPQTTSKINFQKLLQTCPEDNNVARNFKALVHECE